jgi:hypothetical protein
MSQKKHVEAPKQNTGRPWFRLWMVAVIVLALATAAGFLLWQARRNPGSAVSPKALIIDQLSLTEPNASAIADWTNTLKQGGYTVDVVSGGDVNVDFYSRLPALGCQVVVIRSHSGSRYDREGKVMQETFIFTNEPYDESRYPFLQLKDAVAPVKVTPSSLSYFAVGPKYMMNEGRGTFPRTVVIMGGCAGLRLEDLAGAFVAKGASCYISWDASVSAGYLDRGISVLLSKLMSQSVESAVSETASEMGLEEPYNANLKFYPVSSGPSTVRSLTN